jgi:hypothetical protein
MSIKTLVSGSRESSQWQDISDTVGEKVISEAMETGKLSMDHAVTGRYTQTVETLYLTLTFRLPFASAVRSETIGDIDQFDQIGQKIIKLRMETSLKSQASDGLKWKVNIIDSGHPSDLPFMQFN